MAKLRGVQGGSAEKASHKEKNTIPVTFTNRLNLVEKDLIFTVLLPYLGLNYIKLTLFN